MCPSLNFPPSYRGNSHKLLAFPLYKGCVTETLSRRNMDSGASTPDRQSADYHAYTSQPLEPPSTRPNNGPPAYPGNDTGVNSVGIAVEPSAEGENGTNVEVSTCMLFMTRPLLTTFGQRSLLNMPSPSRHQPRTCVDLPT